MPSAEELYETLISPIEGKMVGAIARIMRDPDDAEDVLQEVLAVVWRKLKRIHRHPNPQAYIMRICVSRSYDALRRRARRRQREVHLDTAQAAHSVAPSRAEMREKGDLIRQAIGLLPPNQGRAVLLRLVEDTTFTTIGGILGCSESTARSHVSKGRARLRVLLATMEIL